MLEALAKNAVVTDMMAVFVDSVVLVDNAAHFFCFVQIFCTYMLCRRAWSATRSWWAVCVCVCVPFIKNHFSLSQSTCHWYLFCSAYFVPRLMPRLIFFFLISLIFLNGQGTNYLTTLTLDCLWWRRHGHLWSATLSTTTNGVCGYWSGQATTWWARNMTWDIGILYVWWCVWSTGMDSMQLYFFVFCAF